MESAHLSRSSACCVAPFIESSASESPTVLGDRKFIRVYLSKFNHTKFYRCLFLAWPLARRVMLEGHRLSHVWVPIFIILNGPRLFDKEAACKRFFSVIAQSNPHHRRRGNIGSRGEARFVFWRNIPCL